MPRRSDGRINGCLTSHNGRGWRELRAVMSARLVAQMNLDALDIAYGHTCINDKSTLI